MEVLFFSFVGHYGDSHLSLNNGNRVVAQADFVARINDRPAPIAVAFIKLLVATSDPTPIAVFWLPVVLETNAPFPIAVLLLPVVFENNELIPVAVFWKPVVLVLSELCPTAVLPLAVGGVTPISVDVRVIAATNRDLFAAVKSGAFRDDLYHRLNVVAITPPPLRERKEDIPILADFFLRKVSSATRRNVTAISDGAQARMTAYDWPGNVRELANAIERAVVLGSGTVIGATELPDGLESESATTTSECLSYHDGVNAARKQLVVTALRKTAGNRAAAARLLGLEAKYFLRLIKSLGIE